MWTLVIGNLVHDGDFFPASSWQKFLIAMENVCFVWINVCVKCWDHSVNNAFGQLSVEGFLVNQKCNLMIDQKMEIDFWSTHIEIYYTSSKCTCLNIQNVQFFVTKNPLVNCHFSFGQHAIWTIGCLPSKLVKLETSITVKLPPNWVFSD